MQRHARENHTKLEHETTMMQVGFLQSQLRIRDDQIVKLQQEVFRLGMMLMERMPKKETLESECPAGQSDNESQPFKRRRTEANQTNLKSNIKCSGSSEFQDTCDDFENSPFSDSLDLFATDEFLSLHDDVSGGSETSQL